MSNWYEVKSVEIKHWLVEVEDHEDDSYAIDAVVDTEMSDADDTTVESSPIPASADELSSLMRHTQKHRILKL